MYNDLRIPGNNSSTNMKLKLINIVEMSTELGYKWLYDFDVEKVFIAPYLPTSVRTDKKTEYLSLFGEEKKSLDGDWHFHMERIWKDTDNPKDLFRRIGRNKEFVYYFSEVVRDLIKNIKECDHLLIIGSMRNTASLFLKIILNIAKQHDITCTILYYSPSKITFPASINDNQAHMYERLVSKYPNVNFIYLNVSKPMQSKKLSYRLFEEIVHSAIFDLTKILLDALKDNRLCNKNIIFGSASINSFDEYLANLIKAYKEISNEVEIDDLNILRRYYNRTYFILDKNGLLFRRWFS